MFNGKTLENIRIWLQQMDNLFEATRIPEDERTPLMTRHHLGSAKGFYRSLYYSNDHQHVPWDRFKKGKGLAAVPATPQCRIHPMTRKLPND